MDESERPTDETKGLPSEEPWIMPDPVFRSTPGYSPASKGADRELEIATDPPGFGAHIEDAKNTSQSVRVKEEDRHSRHKKKKGGCAKFFTLLAVIVGLIVGTLIAAAIYFLFDYRPLNTTF